ncbi:MAG TPA: lytic murein transglycosylase [Solirubrobacterales bacterium]|nr:lytic murein transglycosylase [Solirubrobacterales bacterium]HNF83367.1 lytic murein transglycosylase [Solirubrobacterales bacterium]HNI40671.1 lytic murein transglycosylase [Solirubrobacterales bacterium]
MTTRRDAPAATVAVLFFTLIFGSLTWFAASSSEAATTPVPCAPGSASCFAAAEGKAAPAATDVPTSPATTPVQTPPDTGGGDQTGSDGGAVSTPGTGGVVPGETGGSGDGNGVTDPDGSTGEITPGGSEPDFVQQDPGLTGGAGPDSSVDTDPMTSDVLTVPNFVIDQFEIPPFLLPIYQACGSEYGIPWYVLASINRTETSFGTNVATSSAGANGWMAFMPASWAEWGVDANGDKVRDPYNPVDAICSAANYLKYFGYEQSPYDAIFAYNHADWYVQIILRYAKIYSQIPPEVISALTGLTEGARFPVAAADASYEGEVSTEAAKKEGTASQDIQSSSDRQTIAITASGGSPVIAVNDGTITDVNQETGTVVLEDAYGNRYSYAGLGSVSTVHPVPQPEPVSSLVSEESDSGSAPAGDASTGDGSSGQPDPEAEMGEEKAAAPTPAEKEAFGSNPQAENQGSAEPTKQQQQDISEVLVDPDAAQAAAAAAATDPATSDDSNPAVKAADDRRAEQDSIRQVPAEADRNTEDSRGRVYASPLRPSNQHRATTDGQSIQNEIRQAEGVGIEGKPGDYLVYDGSKSGIYRFDPETTELRELKKGSRVIAGTVLGRLAETPVASVNFSIKPGGEDTPQIDPKPFLDGWKLLGETNIYSARGKDRFSQRLGVGGILLLSKSALQKRVLNDPKMAFTQQCDRDYIAAGSIDRRLLATMEFITAHGYSLTISSMLCGRETSITTSGNISNHTHGGAMDIAIINGEVVTPGSQGPGSLTDQVARLVLTLQGTMAPDEVISLMDYPQPAGFAMSDHGDHLHVGFGVSGTDATGGSVSATLGAEQWEKLTERLGQITNPDVPTTPSDEALPAKSDQGGGSGSADEGN